MKIQLSDHFTYRRLLRFTLPSIAMMIFTSIYGVVDGFFVSNFVGETEFTAVNFIMPFLMILGAVGFMFGTGGSAIVAKTLGEGDGARANRYFSLFIYLSAAIGVLLAVGGILLLRPVASLLGARGAMLDSCVVYGRVILIALPAFLLQMELQSFFVTAERPTLGLLSTILSGVTNMVLDALLVGVFPLGLVGAALATAISQAVGGILPLFYFLSPKNKSLLRLTKTRYDGKAVRRAVTNGSSELMSNVSMSLVGMLYNVQLLRYAGEAGVAAYGVMMYVNMIFLAIFIGYSIGTAPIVGYHFGAGNRTELRGLLRRSLVIIVSSSLVMLLLAELLALPLARIFVSHDAALLEMTRHGFAIFAFTFLFAGLAIFFSGFFTALSDGVTSAIISFLRTVVFQIAAVLLLPLALGLDGIWISVVVAEAMAVAVGTAFLLGKHRRFGY